MFGDRASDLAKMANQQKRGVCTELDDWRECHDDFPTGCSDSARSTYDPYLNFLKNQIPPDNVASVKTFTKKEDFASLDHDAKNLLAGSNHTKRAVQIAALGEGNIHTVIGYLYYAFPSGKESCNCQLTGPQDVDFHIGIGFDADLAQQVRDGSDPDKTELQQNSIVVEMTPQYRGTVKPRWTTQRLEKVLGRQVKVVGQLTADTEHAKTRDVCELAESAADKKSCWRVSMWELHPVTEFFVCTSNSPCVEDSDSWKKLEILKTSDF
jgi:hypothetical protein